MDRPEHKSRARLSSVSTCATVAPGGQPHPGRRLRHVLAAILQANLGKRCFQAAALSAAGR